MKEVSAMHIGFLGAGNMAGAMIRGLRAKGHTASDVAAFDVNADKLAALNADCGLTIADSAADLIARSDVVVLAVKPQMLKEALANLQPALASADPLIISIAAGTPLKTLSALCGDGRRIVRVMPNLNATVGEAMSAFCGNALVTDSDFETAEAILCAFGKAVRLPEEQFSAYSALAGCSPAYSMLYMDALVSAGVEAGIDPAIAKSVVAQAVLGTAKLLAASPDSPETWVERVCSPGGTTIEGVKVLRAENVGDAVKAAAEASIRRDEELAKAH